MGDALVHGGAPGDAGAHASPRGFATLDQEEVRALLAEKPVSVIFGVEPAAQERLARCGFRTIADLQRADEIELMKQFPNGRRLWRLARYRPQDRARSRGENDF